MDEKILDFLSKTDEADALAIAKSCVGKEGKQSDVNGTLYALEKAGKVVKSVKPGVSRPRWSLSSSADRTPTSLSPSPSPSSTPSSPSNSSSTPSSPTRSFSTSSNQPTPPPTSSTNPNNLSSILGATHTKVSDEKTSIDSLNALVQKHKLKEPTVSVRVVESRFEATITLQLSERVAITAVSSKRRYEHDAIVRAAHECLKQWSSTDDAASIEAQSEYFDAYYRGLTFRYQQKLSRDEGHEDCITELKGGDKGASLIFSAFKNTLKTALPSFFCGCVNQAAVTRQTKLYEMVFGVDDYGIVQGVSYELAGRKFDIAFASLEDEVLKACDDAIQMISCKPHYRTKLNLVIGSPHQDSINFVLIVYLLPTRITQPATVSSTCFLRQNASVRNVDPFEFGKRLEAFQRVNSQKS
eukprot:TRINITY_DN7664_c0_g1_i1.p1 TRINITY_DN7664_c0_g1~~TRINITY_DN7664_c0_g1_i1.p1  ORF type:complete len:412 (-),score=87.57 TRINITY_DN7664_c0_g1_i1:85-1320(-)